MNPVFALVDCNNFYVSCERVFNPQLIGQPVIVLSNNDGCAVARSNEAKALGIKMAVPLYQIAELARRNNVQVFSSNYALYGDMSQRVMRILTQFTPKMEVYSIDEAFLDLSEFKRLDLAEYGRRIKETIGKWTGIPVSVGFGETKTLAKLAGHLAKKSEKAAGVLDLCRSRYQEKALAAVRVADIWGVGRRYAKFLTAHDIDNALQLRNADEGFIRKKMGITGVRLVRELKGVSCYPLEQSPPPKKSITVSRTFKQAIEACDQLLEAVSAYAAAGAEKLRQERAAAGVLTVYVLTSRFKADYYHNSVTLRFPVRSSDTAELIQAARRGLKDIFLRGCRYKKAGIRLDDLGPENLVQAGFFDPVDRHRSRKLMRTLDEINLHMGSGTIKYGAVGLNHEPDWQTSFNQRSKSYTTRWDQLLEVS